MEIEIPDIFSAMNKQIGNGLFEQAKEDYAAATKDGHPASSCIECKQCEGVCPQHLPITNLLKQGAEMFV